LKTVKVLFVGGSKRYSFAEKLISAGKDFDLNIRIYSYEMGDALPIAEIATVIQGKKFSSSEVLLDLDGVIKRYKVDIAIPFHDGAISLLAHFSDRVFVPVCDKKLINIFDSKIDSAVFFNKNKFPIPPFSGKVPSIAKPDKGSASQGILRFDKQSDLNNFLKSDKYPLYEIQDMVSGPEYSVDCYITKNKQFKYFAVRQRLEVLGGEVIKSKTVNVPPIELLCENILDIPGMSGAITIQFIQNKRDDGFDLMEINPRFGGGMLTSWGAGVPWFHILLRDYLGVTQKPVFHENNVTMSRSFREHFFTD